MKRQPILLAVAGSLFIGAGITFYLRDRADRAAMHRSASPARTTPPSVDELAESKQSRHTVLVREFFRQALLLALREAGQPAFDRVLDNPGQLAAPGEWDADLRLIEDYGGAARVGRPGPPWVWESRIPASNDLIDYPDLARRAESASRHEFRTLAAAAAAPSTRASAAPTTRPAAPAQMAAIERDLASLNPLSQFAAIRAAHQLLDAGGEQPATLGCLVRGYANLGQLTQFLWTSMPKAFTARSILYAERMVVRWPTSRTARWHRAYAYALGGLQGAALSDLDQLEGPAAATQPLDANGAPDPAWAPLLRPYCRYETGKLTAAAQGDDSLAGLATFLGYLTVECCDGSAILNTFGEMVLKHDPDCVRVIDRMVEASGVSFNHRLTVYAPMAFTMSVITRLGSMPDLPPAAREALAALKRAPTDVAAQAHVADVLCAARDDAGHPSWVTLGQLIREVNFVHVARRTSFLVDGLGTNAGAYVHEAMPLVAHHRFRAYVDAYGGYAMGGASLRNVVVVDPVLPMAPLFFMLARTGTPMPERGPGAGKENYFQYLLSEADSTATDYERLLKWDWRQPDRDLQNARYFHRISPFTPLYMAKMVAADWPGAQAELPQWQQQWGDHPVLSAALGRKYAELGDSAQAEKYLKLYLDKAPDAWAFDLLASVYLKQGDEDRWLATEKQILEQPDYALQHAKTNETIAWHFMNKGAYARAEPYSLAAAESYSSWGLTCAAACAEGLRKWDVAADYVRRNAERYGQAYEWFLWCHRTGKGDTPAADRAAARRLTVATRDDNPREFKVERAVRFLLTGDRQSADRTFSENLHEYNDTWSGLQLALLRHAAGNADGRDAALKELLAAARDHAPPTDGSGMPRDAAWVRPQIAKLAALYQSALAGPANAPDREAVEALCAAADTRERRNLHYFAGRIYECCGDRTTAIEYLKRAAPPRRQRLN